MILVLISLGKSNILKNMDTSHELYVARINVGFLFLFGKQKDPGNSSIICNHLMERQKIQANYACLDTLWHMYAIHPNF